MPSTPPSVSILYSFIPLPLLLSLRFILLFSPFLLLSHSPLLLSIPLLHHFTPLHFSLPSISLLQSPLRFSLSLYSDCLHSSPPSKYSSTSLSTPLPAFTPLPASTPSLQSSLPPSRARQPSQKAQDKALCCVFAACLWADSPAPFFFSWTRRINVVPSFVRPDECLRRRPNPPPVRM